MNSNISTKGLFDLEKRLFLSHCQSTNDELLLFLNKPENAVKEGFLVITDFQTKGRGQRNNSWESEPGKNLMFSFLLQPGFLSAKHSFWLSAAVAIGVATGLENFVPEVKVKWPNDIMLNGLKTGGILIENTVLGPNLEQSVVGIGINVNQTNVLPSATSLATERNQNFDKELVLKSVLDEIQYNYFRLQLEGWEKIRSLYYQKLYKMAIPHDYTLPDGETFRAVLKGITEDGLLVLITKNGEQRFAFKEVGF
jgi:BirA family biotin operon repressor/biotin-[acetyl-CoA-carboxylase] ligase